MFWVSNKSGIIFFRQRVYELLFDLEEISSDEEMFFNKKSDFLIISIWLKRYKWKELLNKIDNCFSLDKSKDILKIDISLLNFLILFLLIVYVFYALKNLGQSVHLGGPLDLWNQ